MKLVVIADNILYNNRWADRNREAAASVHGQPGSEERNVSWI